MHLRNQFSKSYFEQGFRKLQKLVDRNGQPPCIILTIDEGHRIELRDFQLTSTRLILKTSSGDYSIPFHTIRSVQFVPQERKQFALSSPRLSLSAEDSSMMSF